MFNECLKPICFKINDPIMLSLNVFWYICNQKRSIRNSRSLRLSPVDPHQKQEPLPERQVQASGLRVRNRPFSYLLNTSAGRFLCDVAEVDGALAVQHERRAVLIDGQTIILHEKYWFWMFFDIFANRKGFLQRSYTACFLWLPAIGYRELKPSPSGAGCGGRLSEPE